MPVGMQEQVAPPELMLAQMMNAGVDHCVLQAGGGYGAMTEMNAFAGRQYPGRMTGLMHVDEAMAGKVEQLAEVDHAFDVLKLRGLYFNVDSLSRHGWPWQLDAPEMEPIHWEKARAAGHPALLRDELGTGLRQGGLHGEPHRVRPRARATPSVIARAHGDEPCRSRSSPTQWPRYQFLPDEALAVWRHEPMVLEVMFPITYGGVWDYPYPEAQTLIEDMKNTFGAHRLMWGSDMPNVERFCTYRQSLDYVRRYCPFLTAREKDLILGDTCTAFYGIGKAGA